MRGGRRSAARFLISAGAFLLYGSLPAAAPACPACRDALAESARVPGQPAPQAVGGAFNASIVFMASMPFFVGGSAIWLIRREL